MIRRLALVRAGPAGIPASGVAVHGSGRGLVPAAGDVVVLVLVLAAILVTAVLHTGRDVWVPPVAGGKVSAREDCDVGMDHVVKCVRRQVRIKGRSAALYAFSSVYHRRRMGFGKHTDERARAVRRHLTASAER